MIVVHIFSKTSAFIEHFFRLGLDLDPQGGMCYFNFANGTIHLVSIFLSEVHDSIQGLSKLLDLLSKKMLNSIVVILQDADLFHLHTQ